MVALDRIVSFPSAEFRPFCSLSCFLQGAASATGLFFVLFLREAERTTVLFFVSLLRRALWHWISLFGFGGSPEGGTVGFRLRLAGRTKPAVSKPVCLSRSIRLFRRARAIC
jgi:hypothetical protein